MKSNKSISQDFFLPKSIFCDFKNGQKTGKKFKIAKNAISQKKIIYDLFDFTSFLPVLFLNFLTRYAQEPTTKESKYVDYY